MRRAVGRHHELALHALESCPFCAGGARYRCNHREHRSNALLLYASTVAHRNAKPLGVLAFVGLGPNLCLWYQFGSRFAAVHPAKPLATSRSSQRSSILTWYPVGSISTLGYAVPLVDAMAADASTLSTSERTDPLVPTYTDGTPINWDGNYAHIDGCVVSLYNLLYT